MLLLPAGAPTAGPGFVATLALRTVRVASGGLAKDPGQDGDRDERDDYKNDKTDDGDAQ